jgi:hypothetical protein
VLYLIRQIAKLKRQINDTEDVSSLSRDDVSEQDQRQIMLVHHV